MTTFSAKYYDGRSTRSHDVVLRADEANVLHVVGLAEALSYPLADVRIAPRLGNTVRSLAFADGARCETSDNDALDRLTKTSGRGRGNALLHRLESSTKYAILAGVLLVLVLTGGSRWGIPHIARHVADSVPERMAYDLGKGTLAVLDETSFEPSLLSVGRRSELRASFANLAKSHAALPLHLEFRRGMGPNAFALPDGTVIVTDDLVSLATDDGQILAVLAHEIGHVQHRHSLRMALESSAVALLVADFGDTTQVTTLSASLPAVYAQAHYSREHETEADSFALEHLKRSGIPARHFAEIMRALQAKSGGRDADGPLEYLASHPPTAERIRRFE